MKADGKPPTDDEVAAYIDRLRDLRDQGCRIKLVQVYTVARQTAEKNVTPLGEAALNTIATKVRELGLAAETYGHPDESRKKARRLVGT